MTTEQRRTDKVYATIVELVDSGTRLFRPGTVAAFLRERGEPIDTWELRGEFSNLEAAGLISVDPATSDWSLASESSRKTG